MTLKQIFFLFGLMALTACSLTGVRHEELPDEVSMSHAEAAEKLRKLSKFASAIEEYKKHIQVRLAKKDRPEDENPYFYYLLIGESYLRLGNLNEAEEAYTIALKQGINSTLVADGFRQISGEYEKRQDYDAAIEILRKHRELDDLLYDAQMDRLHKQSVFEADGQ